MWVGTFKLSVKIVLSDGTYISTVASNPGSLSWEGSRPNNGLGGLEMLIPRPLLLLRMVLP